MNSLTRRSFLQVCGVTLAGAALPGGLALADSLAADMPRALYGRALQAAAITDRPDSAARITGQLWPDAITALHEAAGGFYAVPGGWVPVEAVQPMPGWEDSSPGGDVDAPGWAEVSAPVAPLRGWASAGAPLAGRIGFGGVLSVLDRLTNPDGSIWLAVGARPDGAPLGWTPADRWRGVTLPEPAAADESREVRLDRDRGVLIALEAGREVLRAPVTVPSDAYPGRTTLSQRVPTRLDVPSGAAWVLDGPGMRIYGVHWHNRFGGPGDGPGWEVLPWVARWLIAWLPEGAPLSVV